MLGVLIPVIVAVVTGAGGFLVAWINSQAAKKQSTIATYDQLIVQVHSQQEQIRELFEQVTSLSRKLVSLETRDTAWQTWADDLNLRWDRWRSHLEPPGYPTTIHKENDD